MFVYIYPRWLTCHFGSSVKYRCKAFESFERASVHSAPTRPPARPPARPSARPPARLDALCFDLA